MPPSPPPTDPLVGSRFSRSEIVAKLGGGGMGVVYKARDTKLGRPVALKFLPSQWSHDEAAKQRFMREAQAASATNHRNICVIHDIEETGDGRLFIVMAYYEGETLKHRLERGSLPVSDVIEIAMEVAEGLAKAHAQGVVHRDVKPGNLILTDDGVKILDFGLAKFADALQLTAPGSTIGTYAYMSPEQARGEEADARSDVWALGTVVFEMLTGAPPFRRPYPEATFHAIKYDALPSLRSARPEVPDALERIVVKALTKDPTERYQNAREPARDLRQLAGRTVPLELRTEMLPSMTERADLAAPNTTRRRTPVVAAGLVTALAAGAAAYLWWSRPVEKIRVAIAPVANHTGVASLDRYRLALTESLIDELRESPNIRAVPYVRLLEMVRPFTSTADLSGSEAVHAVATGSGAPFVVVPALVYRDRDASWLMQVQIKNADTGTTVSSYDTAPVNSTLSEQTAFRLVAAAADGVQAHFKNQGGRAYTARPASSRFREPEAARLFASGLDAYEQLEYEQAARDLAESARLDPQHALTHAWASRVSWLRSLKNDAVESAQRAKQLVSVDTASADAAFIEAVLAESRGDLAPAETAYQALAAIDPEDPWSQIELADFLKRRQDRNQAAIEVYHEALKRDAGFIRPHVELCQLYTRIDDHPLAEREAQISLERFRAAGGKGGEAQALLCLAEEQRKQAGGHLVEARKNVDQARALFASLRQPYNLARAEFYRGSVEYSDGHLAAAAAIFSAAADSLGAIGNRALEGVALMNVGSISAQLGQPSAALTSLRSGRQVFLEIGDERRAAEADVNLAGLQKDYGVDPAETIRIVNNARVTLERLGYLEFQLLAMQSEAQIHRYAGRLTRARTLLRSAFEIARSRGLTDNVENLSLELAQADIQANDYNDARAGLEQVSKSGGPASLEARIALASVLIKLGEFPRAGDLLRSALADIEASQRPGLRPLAHTALGQLAREMDNRDLARAEFNAALTSWTDPLPNAAAVAALCDRGLDDAEAGRYASARIDMERGVALADQLGRITAQAHCRVRLARLDLLQHRVVDAGTVLTTIPDDTADITLGRELRAEVEHWRAEALRQSGSADASAHDARARTLLDSVQSALSPEERNRYVARIEIRTILSQSNR